jgi:hypothetical protein
VSKKGFVKPHNQLPPELLDEMARDAGLGDAAGAHESDDCGEIDPLSGISFGLPFFEKFLLAIIDAYPSAENRRKRLRDAMHALLARVPSPGDLPDEPDRAAQSNAALIDQALLWMGAQFARAKEVKPSATELATAAVERYFRTNDPELRASRIGDLSRRFTGSYQKKLKGWDPHANVNAPMTFVYRAMEHDYVRESVEHQMLRRLKHEFEACGIRLNLADE